MDLTKDAIEQIARMTEAKLVNSESGLQYYKRSDALELLTPPTAVTLEVSGLESFCDFISSNIDNLDNNTLIAHVCSPVKVMLCSSLNDFAQRENYVMATTENSNVRIGQWMSPEDMVIMLASSFTDNESRKEALKIIGNVNDSVVKTLEDDGLAQQIVVKASVGGRNEKKDIPELFALAPYRTFPEIEQPDSQFILRARKGQSLPEFALFQFGGDLWKLDAMRKIKAYLNERLGQRISVI